VRASIHDRTIDAPDVLASPARPESPHKSPSGKDLYSEAKTFQLASTTIVPGQNLHDVVLAAGRKDIYYNGILFRGRPVFETPANDETISSSKIEYLSLASDFQMTAHHVDNLVVHMTVNAARPALDHLMLGQKEFVVVRHDPANQSGLGF
jgi:hypothetical protein